MWNENQKFVSSVSVDAGVSEEVVKILTKATNGASLGIENKFLKKSSSDRLGEENASGAIMQKANEKKFLEKFVTSLWKKTRFVV